MEPMPPQQVHDLQVGEGQAVRHTERPMICRSSVSFECVVRVCRSSGECDGYCFDCCARKRYLCLL